MKNECLLLEKQHPLVETSDESLTFEYFQSFISLSSVALDNILASKAWLSFLDNQKDVSVMTLIHIRILESKVCIVEQAIVAQSLSELFIRL